MEFGHHNILQMPHSFTLAHILSLCNSLRVCSNNLLDQALSNSIPENERQIYPHYSHYRQDVVNTQNALTKSNQNTAKD